MRIIAGSARGQRIAVPPGVKTRPTTERVREALFSTLTSALGRTQGSGSQTWSGIRVLDVFAGSGALGLEALSRGARSAVFIESDRKVAAVLRRNIDQLGFPEAHVVIGDAWQTMDRPERMAQDLLPVDVIFVDAPYEVATANIRRLLTQILARGWCREEGLVVIERSAREESSPWPRHRPDEGWQWEEGDERRYGETALWYGRCVRKH
jgi:16S rRNA (guanine966-N2)-methyltransferase